MDSFPFLSPDKVYFLSRSLERLSEMFELPLKTVHSIVSKMIIREEFLVGHMTFMRY